MPAGPRQPPCTLRSRTRGNSIRTLEIRHRATSTVIVATCVRTFTSLVTRLGWPRSATHARKHALILGSLLWIAAAVVMFAGQGDRGIAGPLKGADFVHFYTLGHLAASQQVAALYDANALHDTQVALVPESNAELYPTVYPPQAAILFTAFAQWSYRTSLLVWSVISIALYGAILWSGWQRVSDQLSDRRLIVYAAAAFPPFWALVVYGQVAILILVAFWLGWLALERGRPYLAGAAFGLLALKPQFGIPLAAVVVACGEWRMLTGAVISVGAQSLMIWVMLGWSVFEAFARSLGVTLMYAEWLEAKPFMSHSLRAVTRLLPDAIGLPLWLALCAYVLWYTVRVWKSRAPVRVRLGIVMLAAVLVNPHVIIYDVTVLALPLLWFGAYMREDTRQPRASAFGTLVYWLFVALFVPTAAVIGVQASVPIMMAVLVVIARETTPPSGSLIQSNFG